MKFMLITVTYAGYEEECVCVTMVWASLMAIHNG